MNILIVEDEKPIAEQLQHLLLSMDPQIHILAIIPSASKTVQWLKQYLPATPDLIFMDIHLEDTRAFRIFEEIEVTCPVIFITAFDQYVLQAFKSNGIDYLLKPVDATELQKAITRYKALGKHFTQPLRNELTSFMSKLTGDHYRQRFMTAVGSRLESVAVQDVAYFYVAFKSTFLITQDKRKLPLNLSLDSLSDELDPRQFFRINRQMLVSYKSIAALNLDGDGRLRVKLTPDTGEEVMVSTDRVSALKDWLGR